MGDIVDSVVVILEVNSSVVKVKDSVELVVVGVDDEDGQTESI